MVMGEKEPFNPSGENIPGENGMLFCVAGRWSFILRHTLPVCVFMSD